GWPGALLLLTLTLLGACSVAPPAEPQLPFDLPDRFDSSLVEPFQPTERWWTEFEDPLLESFVDTALVRNPGVAQALARASVAEARVRLNRGERLPQAGIGFTSARQRQNMGSMAGPLGEFVDDELSFISNNHNASLDVSWELDLWGRLAAASSAAQAEFLASAEQLRGARQSVAAQVVQLYYDVVHARAQEELSARTVDTLAEMARQISNRVDVGIASPTDAMLAEANLGSARGARAPGRRRARRAAGAPTGCACRRAGPAGGGVPAGCGGAFLPAQSGPDRLGWIQQRPAVRPVRQQQSGLVHRRSADATDLPGRQAGGPGGHCRGAAEGGAAQLCGNRAQCPGRSGEPAR